jgi:hypothetical protein
MLICLGKRKVEEEEEEEACLWILVLLLQVPAQGDTVVLVWSPSSELSSGGRKTVPHTDRESRRTNAGEVQCRAVSNITMSPQPAYGDHQPSQTRV